MFCGCKGTHIFYYLSYLNRGSYNQFLGYCTCGAQNCLHSLGISTQKVVPCPDFDLTSIFPLCRVMIL